MIFLLFCYFQLFKQFGKIASIVGGVADGIGGLSMLGSLTGVGGNSASAILTGVRVAGTAANVSSLADIGNSLAGAEGQNYGEHCSLLTIPASELEKGKYGVYFLGNMFGPNLAILCYTFSVQ